jgi:dATP pyrophosphohydrolase
MPEIDASCVEVYVFRRAAGGVEFLLLKRRDGDFMGATWHPVSGGIGRGEKAWQAAERELYEEAGLTEARLWQVDSVNSFYVAKYDRVMITICFAAEVGPDVAIKLSAEHSELAWVPEGELAQRLLWPGQRRIAAEIREEILGPGPTEPFLRLPENLDK